MRRTADQMPLNIECVVDRRMNRNKALSRFSQFEALHLSLSPPDRLMRGLRTGVGTYSLLMPSRETKVAKRRPVRSQFISDDDRRDKALAAKELAQKAHCRGLVAPGLNENFQNLAFAIDGAPQVHLLSRERDHQSSGPGESHPQALTDPDVSVSTHPAPTVQPLPDTAMANVQKELVPDARWRGSRPAPVDDAPSGVDISTSPSMPSVDRSAAILGKVPIYGSDHST